MVGNLNGCSALTSIAIPEGVKTIQGWSFSDCSSLAEVTISDSVTTIEASVFRGCSRLNTVICLAKEVPTLDENVFYHTPNSKKLKVDCDLVETYQSSDWALYFTNIYCDESALQDVSSTEFSIFPNPVEKAATIVVNLQDIQDKTDLMLTDTQGRIIINEHLLDAAQQYKKNTSNLSVGVYYLIIRTQNRNITEKLIVK